MVVVAVRTLCSNWAILFKVESLKQKDSDTVSMITTGDIESSPVDGLITWRPRQNDHHFPDDLFKWIFLNENVWISIQNWLKIVPMVPINNIPAMV